MRSLLAKIVVATLAVSVAAWLVPGIRLGGAEDAWPQRLGTALAVGAILALLRMVLRPLLTLLSLPLLVLTLGLFWFVIGAVLLWLTSLAAGQVGLAFHVREFWWDAVLGALIVAVCSMVAEPFFGDGGHVRLSRRSGRDRSDARAAMRNAARDDVERGRLRRGYRG